MRLTTTTYGLAFLTTTLIVAAVSLPQSSSLPESSSLPRSTPDLNNDTPSYGLKGPPANWTPPIGCVGIGAHNVTEHVKRDLQTSENNNAALQPRTNPSYACGKLNTGWESDTFQFFTTSPVFLAWNIGHGYTGFNRETVTLMQVNSNGHDTVVGGETGIFNWRNSAFTPVIGALYYVDLHALPHCLLTWWIAPLT